MSILNDVRYELERFLTAMETRKLVANTVDYCRFCGADLHPKMTEPHDKDCEYANLRDLFELIK